MSAETLNCYEICKYVGIFRANRSILIRQVAFGRLQSRSKCWNEVLTSHPLVQAQIVYVNNMRYEFSYFVNHGQFHMLEGNP